MNYLLLENYIKELLKENKEHVKIINIFDFDATLFKTKKEPDAWPRKGRFWYNAEESVNPLYYENNINGYWIDNTVKEVFNSMINPEALTVLCTARSNQPEIVYATNSLLRQKGLEFDNNCLFYKPTNFRGNTAQYKAGVVKTLLNAYSFCNELHFWEDNLKNLEAVKKLIDNNNLVNPNRQILFVDHVVQA